MVLPQPFTNSSPLVFNVDYFDWARNTGYKTFYLLGTRDSVGDKYILTEDSSLSSDSANYKTSNGDDLNFDLTFENPVDIAGDLATISYHVQIAGEMSTTVVWTVYHYDGTTETSLGTVTNAVSGTTHDHLQATCQLQLTKKHFAAGDTLRINAVVTSTHTGTFMLYDPAGTISNASSTGQTVNSSASINIPFIIE